MHIDDITTLKEAVAELGNIRSDLMYNRRQLSFRQARKDLRTAILAKFPDADPGHAAWIASFA